MLKRKILFVNSKNCCTFAADFKNKVIMRRNFEYELHIYWEDDVTIECRYFKTKKEAMQYVKDNGIEKYMITKEDIDEFVRTY